MAELKIVADRYDSPVAGPLIVAALADLGVRYGGEGDETPVDAAEFVPPRGAFLIAYLDGEPVGCGGWRARGADAEIKRMYVAPSARNQGVASALLRAVEESARGYQRRRTILETGDRQPEAIALYQKLGYHRIANFGHYRDEPGVRSFGREL